MTCEAAFEDLRIISLTRRLGRSSDAEWFSYAENPVDRYEDEDDRRE